MNAGMDFRELLEEARQARRNAYAPYSGFAVGAALLTGEGRVFTGCNVENASFCLTVCAERVAVLKAVSEGQRQFRALAITAEGEDFCYPCGACRQVLLEFAADLPVVVGKAGGEFRVFSLGELLPQAFCGDELTKGEKQKHE